MSRKKYYNSKHVNLYLFALILVIGISTVVLNNYSKNNGLNISDKTATIYMKNLAFSPSLLTIKINTTVTWVNKDVAIHNVHSGTPEKPTPIIVSKNLSKGQKFSYKFTKKGAYKYYCTIHSSIMQATIIVK